MRILVLTLALLLSHAMASGSLFIDGTRAYQAGEYAPAASAFRQLLSQQPSSGALQNLGNAEWQRGRPGPALLAWEQARWIDPFNGRARNNLQLARKTLQIEAPDLAWQEVISSWLPVNWWSWLAGASFWLAVAMVMLPAIFRRPRKGWHQAVAAFSLTGFLLTLPAMAGVHTRSHLGFILQKDVPLRLTPTTEAQTLTRLAAGEPARLERSRGKYLLVRTNHAVGWVETTEFGLIQNNY